MEFTLTGVSEPDYVFKLPPDAASQLIPPQIFTVKL
jgi:hypothetical protein